MTLCVVRGSFLRVFWQFQFDSLKSHDISVYLETYCNKGKKGTFPQSFIRFFKLAFKQNVLFVFVALLLQFLQMIFLIFSLISLSQKKLWKDFGLILVNFVN